MTGTNRYIVLNNDLSRMYAARACQEAPDGHVATIKPASRSLEQNALMWPLLQKIAKQVDWHGYKLTDEEWKDVLTASLKKQKVVPGLDGSFVVCGQSTSQMSKKEFSDLLELIYAFGAQQGVEFEVVA
jgi:hypothetical protein